jgi:hypothetical protein
MSNEKPPWRKAIEDYERSIGKPLEEFVKSDQFADMAAKAAKQGTQMPQIPQIPQMPGSPKEFLHAMGVAAASDMEELRAEVHALRDDVRALSERIAQEREQPEAAPKAKPKPKPKAKPKPAPKAKATAKPKPAPKATPAEPKPE